MTEVEIDQIINRQPASEIFYKSDILAHSSDKLYCTELERSHVNQSKERSVDNPICLIGSITHIHDFPIFDLSDDDFLQTEDDLAGSSLVDLWEENQSHSLPENNEPMPAIYDIDGESYDSIIADEDFMNLHSALIQIINETRSQ